MNQEKIVEAIAAKLDENLNYAHIGYEIDCTAIATEILTAIAPHLEAGAGWEDAPSWANYLAMDANGYWYWYEEKPQLSRGIWAFGGERSRKTLHKQDVAWNESLQERPK